MPDLHAHPFVYCIKYIDVDANIYSDAVITLIKIV